MTVIAAAGSRPPPDSIEEALDDIAARGIEAIRHAKSHAGDAVASAAQKREEVVQGARDMTAAVDDIVLKWIRERPYATLAIAGAVGFAYGALRRR